MLRWLKRKPEEQKPEQEIQIQESQIDQNLPLEFVSEQPTNGAWLETFDKQGQKLFLPLRREKILLGTSEECDLKLSDNLEGFENVNSKHARIERWHQCWLVAPVDKNCAVFVNGKRTGENALKDGCEIQLGEKGVKFVFREAVQQE